MFITEQQLTYLQSRDSRYKNNFMADIVAYEFQSSSTQDIFKYVSCLLHKLVDIDNNIWEVQLPDKSVILIKENKDGVFIKCLPSIVDSHFNSYFV